MDECIKDYIKNTDIKNRLHKPFIKGKDYDITFFYFKEIERILQSLRQNFNGFFITSIENYYGNVVRGIYSTSYFEYFNSNPLIEVFNDYDEFEYYVKRFE